MLSRTTPRKEMDWIKRRSRKKVRKGKEAGKGAG